MGEFANLGTQKPGLFFFQCFIGQLTVERVTGFERHNELIPFEHEPPRICLVYCHVILPQDDDPLVCDLWRYPTYPLVNCYIAIEHGHRNSGFSHWKLWLSIVMLVYQRVSMGLTSATNQLLIIIKLVTTKRSGQISSRPHFSRPHRIHWDYRGIIPVVGPTVQVISEISQKLPRYNIHTWSISHS